MFKQTINWEKGRRMFLNDPDCTLIDVANAIKSTPGTVRAKASKENWSFLKTMIEQGDQAVCLPKARAVDVYTNSITNGGLYDDTLRRKILVTAEISLQQLQHKLARCKPMELVSLVNALHILNCIIKDASGRNHLEKRDLRQTGVSRYDPNNRKTTDHADNGSGIIASRTKTEDNPLALPVVAGIPS